MGVTPAATQNEVKKAYRRLAMLYHPDKNQDNQYAEAHFREIQEAYATLSNSLLRERYDDERWLNGVSKKSYAQAVTPAWLLTVTKELTKSLSMMDTHRISQRSLQEYILLILSDAHLGVLLQHNDEEKNKIIISELLKAASWLHMQYLPEIQRKLTVLAGSNEGAAHAVNQFIKDRERQDLKQRLFPYIILLVTLALCAFMYFYGEKN